MAVLDDIISGKTVSLSRLLQNVLTNIYLAILRVAPGYAVRNCVSNLLNVMQNKQAPCNARECGTNIVGLVLHGRSTDCGSIISEVTAVALKMAKSAFEVTTKIAAVKCLTNIVMGAGVKVTDVLLDIVKVLSKTAADKSMELRICTAGLLAAVVANQAPGPVVAEFVVTSCIKSLEDDVAVVQVAYAKTLAQALYCQMRAQAEHQEKQSVSKNRGDISEESSATPSASSMSAGGQNVVGTKTTARISSKISTAFSAAMGSSKNGKILDEYTLSSSGTSIRNLRWLKISSLPLTPPFTSTLLSVSYLSKNILSSRSGSRSALIAALAFLYALVGESLSASEVEGAISNTLDFFRDSSVSVLGYEELVFFRARLSFLIRSGLIHPAGEVRRLFVAEVLLNTLRANLPNSTGMETTKGEIKLSEMPEHALVFCLSEVAHVVSLMRNSAISLVDDITAIAPSYLSHSSYTVRYSAGLCLSSCALLVHSRSYTILLRFLDEAKELAAGIIGDARNVAKNSTDSTNQKASMLKFHGLALTISMLLKSAFFPSMIVDKVFSFGIELLREDTTGLSGSQRITVVSIIRAGGLIASSCMNSGYAVIKSRVLELLLVCDLVFKSTIPASPAGGSSDRSFDDSSTNLQDQCNTGALDESWLFEMMTVESALVSVSSLLLNCPEVLLNEDQCLCLVVSGLEMAFRALRIKYQPRLKQHFRFRTLHSILLECFASLPPGSFSNSVQPVFIEALRVFRDSVAAGLATTRAVEFMSPSQAVLEPSNYISTGGSGFCHSTNIFGVLGGDVTSDVLNMLRLENHSTALQKKEFEAFLASLGKSEKLEGIEMTLCPTSKLLVDEHLPMRSGVCGLRKTSRASTPVAQVDSRTVNAAIALLSSTFVHQSPEFQNKAIMLCSQAVEQFSLPHKPQSSSSSGYLSSSLFGSESEEKRRNEFKAYNASRNVVVAFCAIASALPVHHGALLEEDLSWGTLLVDSLLDLCISSYTDVRVLACNALATFASRVPSSGVLELLTDRVSTTLSVSLDRKSSLKGRDARSELSGYLILLVQLFSRSSRPDTRLHIMATVFDCIRKVDLSCEFRAHAFYALSHIFSDVAELVGEVSADNQTPSTDTGAAFRAFLDKVWHSLDVHAVSVSAESDAWEMLLSSLMRLIFAATPLTLQHIPSNAFVDHLLSTFDSVRCVNTSAPNPTLQEECLALLNQLPPVVYKRRSDALSEIVIDLLVKHTNDNLWGGFGNVNCVPGGSYTMASLSSLLRPVAILCSEHTEESMGKGMDIVLFHVLEWVRTRPAPDIANVPGIESKFSGRPFASPAKDGFGFFSGREPDSGEVAEEISMLLTQLAERHCQLDPDRALTSWLLTLRCISTSIFATETEHDENDPGMKTSARSKAEMLTYQSLISFTRAATSRRILALMDSIKHVKVKGTVLLCSSHVSLSSSSFALNFDTEKSTNLSMPTASTRTFAMKLAARLLSEIPMIQTDISEARLTANQHLNEVSIQDLPREAPLYLPLFLHDLVTMAVSCSTLIVHDKPIRPLQIESVRLLQRIVQIFGNTTDPDTVKVDHDEENERSRALTQYTSQIQSAVRAGLTAPSDVSTVELRRLSRLLLCELIETGLCSDAVLIRRLLGNITIGLADELRPHVETGCEYSVLASGREHLATHWALARLYVAATSGLKTSVTEAILAILQPKLDNLTSVWQGMVIDAVRFMQPQQSSAHLRSQDLVFPLASPSTSPSRGGITYSPIINCSEQTVLQSYLIAALPTVLVAAASAFPAIQTSSCNISSVSSLPTMFSIALGLLDRASEIMTSVPGKKSDAELAKIVMYALHTLRYLAEGKYAHTNDEISDGDADKTVSIECLGLASSGLSNNSVFISRWIPVVHLLTNTVLIPKSSTNFDDSTRAAFDLLLALALHCHQRKKFDGSGLISAVEEDRKTGDGQSCDEVRDASDKIWASLTATVLDAVVSVLQWACPLLFEEEITRLLLPVSPSSLPILEGCSTVLLALAAPDTQVLMSRMLLVAIAAGEGNMLSTITLALCSVSYASSLNPITQLVEFWTAINAGGTLECRQRAAEAYITITAASNETQEWEPLLSAMWEVQKQSNAFAALTRAVTSAVLVLASIENVTTPISAARSRAGLGILPVFLPFALQFLCDPAAASCDDGCLVLLQIIFLVYKKTKAREAFVSTVVPALCEFLVHYPPTQAYTYVGRALTQLATTHGLAFKATIATLCAPLRYSLQTCMTSSLKKAQSSHNASNSTGKIDASKFKSVS